MWTETPDTVALQELLTLRGVKVGGESAMASNDYLVKKGNVWLAAVTVPKELRELLGTSPPEGQLEDLQPR